jgi:predicted ferric reductase
MMAGRYERWRSFMVRAHLVSSRSEGRLTAKHVLAVTDAEPAALSVFLCGPASMVSDFQKDFRRTGVASRRIFREYFDLR